MGKTEDLAMCKHRIESACSIRLNQSENDLLSSCSVLMKRYKNLTDWCAAEANCSCWAAAAGWHKEVRKCKGEQYATGHFIYMFSQDIIGVRKKCIIALPSSNHELLCS